MAGGFAGRTIHNIYSLGTLRQSCAIWNKNERDEDRHIIALDILRR